MADTSVHNLFYPLAFTLVPLWIVSCSIRRPSVAWDPWIYGTLALGLCGVLYSRTEKSAYLAGLLCWISFGISTHRITSSQTIQPLKWNIKSGQKLYIIRHGESVTNAASKYQFNSSTMLSTLQSGLMGWWNGDPGLSPVGMSQTKKTSNFLDNNLRASLTKHDTLYVVSPQLRALETAFNIFPNIQRWAVCGHLREKWNSRADTGSDIKHIAEKFSSLDLETCGFSKCSEWRFHHSWDPMSWHKEPDYGVNNRIKEFTDWVRTRDEKNIVVVGHSNFFHHLIQGALNGRKVENLEVIEIIEGPERKITSLFRPKQTIKNV